VGDRVNLLRGHPWNGSEGEVVSDPALVGLTKSPMVRVKLIRDDAMDGHECFARAGHMQPNKPTRSGKEKK
jgi:hypothetical protein